MNYGQKITPLMDHDGLDPNFLTWYLNEFKNYRPGYVHTPVCSLHGDFTEYHQVVALDKNGQPEVYYNTPISVDLDKHTDGRNTGSFSLSIDGFGDAGTENLGTELPAKNMIDLAVHQLAVDCINLRVPVGILRTHAEAANNVDYPNSNSPGVPAPPAYGPGTGPDFMRWDFHVGYNPSTGEFCPMFNGATALYPTGWMPLGLVNAEEITMPAGFIYFPNYARKAVILEIQKLTKFKWQTNGSTKNSS